MFLFLLIIQQPISFHGMKRRQLEKMEEKVMVLSCVRKPKVHQDEKTERRKGRNIKFY